MVAAIDELTIRGVMSDLEGCNKTQIDSLTTGLDAFRHTGE